MSKTLEETLFKSFKLFLAEKCYNEKLYGDGKYDKKIFNWAFQAGKDSIKEEIEYATYFETVKKTKKEVKEEILNKLPERKSENKKKKDQEEWINIPRIQRAVGFNSCLNQVKNIIKNV